MRKHRRSSAVFASQIVQSLCFLNPKFQASDHFRGCTALFVSELIVYPEDRFSHDMAHLQKPVFDTESYQVDGQPDGLPLGYKEEPPPTSGGDVMIYNVSESPPIYLTIFFGLQVLFLVLTKQNHVYRESDRWLTKEVVELLQYRMGHEMYFKSVRVVGFADCT